MKMYMIYPNQFALGNKPIGIASLAATLISNGHQIKLLDCTSFKLSRPEVKDDIHSTFVVSLEYKPSINSDRLPERCSITFDQLCELACREIDSFKPDIIGVSALTDDYPLGINLLRRIRSTFPNLPTIVGGVHATVDPMGVMREQCVDYVCVGEGEGAILDIATSIDQKKKLNGIPNVWYRFNGNIIKSAPRSLIADLDSLPFPDWTIYGPVAFYKPYMGYVYKYGDFEMSRGCPYKCSYCVNVGLQQLYKLQDNPTNYHREKSIDRVIREIKWAIDNYQIEFLKFWDETFLLMSKTRIEEFRDKYSDLKIPYVIETTAESVTPFTSNILRLTNCKSASLGMETGSPDLRKGILNKPTDNKKYLSSYALLKANDVRGVSFNMIGLPGESKEDIFRTITLNRLVGTENQAVGIFYPYKGTPIRNWIQKQGLMEEDYEYTQLQKNDFTTFTAGRSTVVRLKDMSPEELFSLKDVFSLYVHLPFELYPLIDFVKNNTGAFKDILLINLRRVLYVLRYGDNPQPYLDTIEGIRQFCYVGPSLWEEFAQEMKLGIEAFREKNKLVFDILIREFLGEQFFPEFMKLFKQSIVGGLKAEVPVWERGYYTDIDHATLDEEALYGQRLEMNSTAKIEAKNYYSTPGASSS